MGKPSHPAAAALAVVVSRRLGWLWRLLAWLVPAYGLVLALLWWRQEWLLFRPQPLAAEYRFDLEADVHEGWVEVPGARLNVLHLRLPAPDGVVFYLHGNAGNLASWFVDLGLYRRANLDLVMPDYRGYGKSSGRIDSEEQLLADMRAVWSSVAPRYAGQRRVFMGRSLGTGLAARLAAEQQPELTLLVSPYFSLQALAREHYPWVPGAVLRYPLRTDLALPGVRGEVLLVHGEHDTLIDPLHSRRLHDLLRERRHGDRAAPGPAPRRLVVPGAGHNDLQGHASYTEALAAALSPAR